LGLEFGSNIFQEKLATGRLFKVYPMRLVKSRLIPEHLRILKRMHFEDEIRKVQRMKNNLERLNSTNRKKDMKGCRASKAKASKAPRVHNRNV